jgi:uncharacterized membrane protein
MLKNLYLYLITIPVFFAIDLIWIGIIAKDFYRKQIGHLMRADTNWAAALIFYLIFIIGLFVFGILPALEKSSWRHAVIFGGLFGFFCYATFDFTCYALFKDFPLQVVIADLIWGTVLSASVSAASFFIGHKWIF